MATFEERLSRLEEVVAELQVTLNRFRPLGPKPEQISQEEIDRRVQVLIDGVKEMRWETSALK